MGIRLSNKHGVNPGLTICWFCGEASGVALHGVLPDDAEAPREMIYDMEPCSKCQDVMKQGIMFVEIKSEDDFRRIEADRRDWQERAADLKRGGRAHRIPPFVINPAYRTGRLWGIKDSSEMVQLITEPLKSQLLVQRWTLLAESTARQLGLPHDDACPARPGQLAHAWSTPSADDQGDSRCTHCGLLRAAFDAPNPPPATSETTDA